MVAMEFFFLRGAAEVFFKILAPKPNQKHSRKRDDAVFPTVTLSVAMETRGHIWPNFELIQALMHVLITCKYEKDPSKNSEENVMTSFCPL